jgi:hydroxymethylpyrimidine/phosphomethylpyrimidine kinase
VTRLPGKSPRGTGCALATAIAVGLARGQPLEQAVEAAKLWLAGRIQAAVAIGGARYL